jgi:hypothetical protein
MKVEDIRDILDPDTAEEQVAANLHPANPALSKSGNDEPDLVAGEREWFYDPSDRFWPHSS